MLNFPELLNAVKERIRQAQTRAVISANAELLMLYWDIGSLVAWRQHEEGWGANIIPRFARDIKMKCQRYKNIFGVYLQLLQTKLQFCHRQWQNWLIEAKT